MPDLSVIVVSWNVRELLARCLGSLTSDKAAEPDGLFRLPDGRSFDVWVVDNNSDDGSPAMVRERFPAVRLIALEANRGFAAANNTAIRQCQGRALLLLNPDTQVIDQAVTVLLDYLDAHPEVGVVGPQLRYADGTLQSSRRRFPTPLTGFFESTLLHQWFPRNHWAARYHMQDVPEDIETRVDWLVGAALMVRRQAVEQAGLLDEAYFLYSEELEWCRRISAHGWQIVYLPKAVVLHHEGRSSEQVAAARHIYFQTSKLRYYAHVHGPRWAAALRAFLLATYAWQWLEEGLKWLVGHRRPLRAARLRAYGQVLRSSLRPAQSGGARP
ncbi:MAG: glycosyltransferase family 2 protein [Anaerolineae bacterium]